MKGLGEPHRGPIQYHTSNSLLARAESKAKMFTRLRRATILALAGGAAIAAQVAAVTPAQAATPTITIAATSKTGPVTGYILVYYRSGAYASARIHGTITGGTAGEVATLYAQPFPYEKPAAPAGSSTLGAAAAGAYSFTVKPTLATRYEVKLFAGPSATTPLATSPTQNVYVSSGGSETGREVCIQGACSLTSRVLWIVPSSALRFEMSKHVYVYFGISFRPPSAPKPPEWLYLNAGHSRVTRAQRISADEFETTVTFSYHESGYSTGYPAWTGCDKDTVAKDGMGLPGHHGCGSNRVRLTVAYLG
jgi:hypothetical protein